MPCHVLTNLKTALMAVNHFQGCVAKDPIALHLPTTTTTQSNSQTSTTISSGADTGIPLTSYEDALRSQRSSHEGDTRAQLSLHASLFEPDCRKARRQCQTSTANRVRAMLSTETSRVRDILANPHHQ